MSWTRTSDRIPTDHEDTTHAHHDAFLQPVFLRFDTPSAFDPSVIVERSYYGVDRSTASRWVSRAFDALSAGFATQMGPVTSMAQRDLMSALQSGLEVSLRDVLGED